MSRRNALVLCLAAVALGCAGSDPGVESSGRSLQPFGGGALPPTQTAGMSAPQPTGVPGGFGNSTAMTPNLPMQQEMTGDGCVVGQFCKPTEPDPDDCGSLTLEAEVEVIEHPGNVLLVFDRSSSMDTDWNGQRRWQQAGGAIESALKPLADKLTAGSVFFPSPDPGAMPVCVDPTGITCIFVPFLALPPGTCGVNPIDAADQIGFLPGAEFLTALGGAASGALYAPVQGGFTPLTEGLQEAQRALASASLTGITSVIVITDGEPNCEWDRATSQQIVSDWQRNGINTYVIGLPGVQGMGPQVLNELAATGGTGSYLTPDDSAALEQQLREIAMETVQAGFESCEITINPPAEAPEKLHLVVTDGGVAQEVNRDLADDYRWNVTDDGSLVTLEGRLCEDAMNGRFEALRFEFGCVDVPPLDPPPPLE